MNPVFPFVFILCTASFSLQLHTYLFFPSVSCSSIFPPKETRSVLYTEKMKKYKLLENELCFSSLYIKKNSIKTIFEYKQIRQKNIYIPIYPIISHLM